MRVISDAAVLIAADRSDRRIWAEHAVRLIAGDAPVTTAPVVAQVSRSARQVNLRRFLRGCEVMPFARDDGHPVGALLARAGSADMVDGHLVRLANVLRVPVMTADHGDLHRLSRHVRPPVTVLRM